MPPSTKPADWNTAKTKEVNNSYNYATDNMNEEKPGKPKPKPAKPGGTKGLDPFKFKFVKKNGKWKHMRKITCQSLITVCTKIDKIKLEKHCETNEKCWRIALFIKHDANDFGDDYHFAREDRKAVPAKDGQPGQTAQWSHKMKDGDATTKCYNPDSKKFDGQDITDPKKQTVYPGYTFCDYLCVCPDQKVAYLDSGKFEQATKVAMKDDDSQSKEGV